MGRLEVAVHSGSHLQFCEAMWGPVYEAVLNILGSTGTVLPVGDPLHGQPNAATFKSVGEEQVTFTWSEAPSLFDAKLDLTDPASYKGIVPIVDFNGIDEEADTPDATYWSRGNGTADSPFSVGAWVNPDALATVMLLARDDNSVNREWQFQPQLGGAFGLILLDRNPSNIEIFKLSATPYVAGKWQFLVSTYDATGGATAANGILNYLDGVDAGGTASNNASYVAMENLASVTSLAFRASSPTAQFFNGKMAGGPLGPFFTQKVLTLDEVKRLYEIGRRVLALR